MRFNLHCLLPALQRFKSISQTKFIFLVVAYVMLSGNMSLFGKIINIYPLSVHNIGFVTSLFLFFCILTTLFFMLVSVGNSGRWIIAILLIISAQSAYYMDNFGVIIDTVMIDNILHTDAKEIAGLINIGLISRTIFLGVLPAWFVIKCWPSAKHLRTELKSRLENIAILLAILFTLVLISSAGYTSFIREHKITRFYANPTFPVYSAIKYSVQQLHSNQKVPFEIVAKDSQFVEPHAKNELVIMVVGETARYDRFSLNGYHRITNPRLAQQDVISFSNVSSCGTSTGISVPCMFSVLGRKNFKKKTALNQQNVLDVLAEHGVEVLWRDNNSDSKGVALRVKYEDFKSPTNNPECKGECRDIGMLSGLDQYITSKKGKDILIVLHQMGNHGPEYYRRYPKQFEQFKPICMTGELRDCTQQEIDNSYDNAILYTDYFLSETINFLKKYDQSHETAMLYVADHGESLGEKGIYLHAAPYLIAPKEQTHVPAIVWMGKHFDFKKEQLLPYKDYPLSHDDVFCSLLTAFELSTQTCANSADILKQNEDHTAELKP